MRHWSQLATRNWRAKRVRTLGALLAITLGAGAVVWVTCCYESVRAAMLEWARTYLGNAQINIQSPLGHYDTLPQDVEETIAKVPNVEVVVPLLTQRMEGGLARVDRSNESSELVWMDEFDLTGIDVEREPAVRDWSTRIVSGRMLTTDDQLACVLERAIAQEAGVGVGDRVLIDLGPDRDPVTIDVVGLVERRRIAKFLRGLVLVRLPVLQDIVARRSAARSNLPLVGELLNRIGGGDSAAAAPLSVVTSFDIVLTDKSKRALEETAVRIRSAIRTEVRVAQVRSTASRLTQVERAQQQQEIVLVLLSCVAMLTALFIILSTLSMGLVERVAQMGLTRCVGATRWQLAALTLIEVVPLGIIGIVLGVPVGLALTALTVQLVPEYVGSFAVSLRGIALACAAGFATTVVAAILPALAAARVSPLEATRPRARRAPAVILFIAFALSVATLAVQVYIVDAKVRRDMDFINWAAASVVLLYAGYAAVAPFAVWVVSRVAVPLAALALRLRSSLLQDQVGRAVWRSAGICCGLMVGLSLIVGLAVFNESFKRGWQFPKQFPEGYIWSFEQIPGDVRSLITGTPGVKNFATANAINVIVEERGGPMEQVLMSQTWFMGADPDEFLDLVKLDFLDGEGDELTARALLRQGGHILIAADFARSRRKSFHQQRDADGNVILSNKVRIWFNDRWTEFTVAGVIDSPALDIAAGYFQLESQAYVVASGSVIGTQRDLKQRFGIDGTKLVLMNFDIAESEPPADWTPPTSASPMGKPTDDYFNATLPRASRWRYYQEAMLLQGIRDKIGARQAFWGTARELKDQIDSELTRMTYLLTAVPLVALIVAAVGVANLMTANVAARTKAIAIMRAVGATRGQIIRLVIGEAAVLGLLGSALGLTLGMHLAWNTSVMTARMWGFDAPFSVPWGIVIAAVALTIGLCIIAGVLPARHASRTNVIDALHVA